MKASQLVKLGDTDITVSDAPEDIRGRWVIDCDGEEIGYIDDLLIDDQERMVRFLQIASTGMVREGEPAFLLPADAVTRVTADEVMIDQMRAKVVGAPSYDPEVRYGQEYYDEVYGYYGYPPFWSADDPSRPR